MKFSLLLLAAVSLSSLFQDEAEPVHTLAPGSQPQVSQDTKGVIRVAFGRNDSIFCATSLDNGSRFSPPAYVGRVDGMHLGLTRGPQLASSAAYSVITVIDGKADIHFFQLAHAGGKWTYKGRVNDQKETAPEGLMSIAADDKDNFYAVWLDVRQQEQNNVCFSSLSGKEGKWSRNRIVYTSPDKHVCECCKPSIAVRGDKVAIQFRNWLNGSRDLYLLQSSDRGKTFAPVRKLGHGTWKLKACPMDGGGVAIDANGLAHTTWRREGLVYYCQPGEAEQEIGKGRLCSLVTGKASGKVWVVMQEGNDLKLIDPDGMKQTVVGQGGFIKSVSTSGGDILCVWEQDKQIRFKKLEAER